MKRGVTLIELTVSMGIFTIIATLAIGAFVSVSRMKAMTTSMREAQQKVRIATETITRLSKQANVVKIPNEHEIVLYFDDVQKMSKFSVSPDMSGKLKLYYYQSCVTGDYPSYTCTDWGAGEDMLGDIIEINDKGPTMINFEQVYLYGRAELHIYLPGKAISVSDNSYFPNDLNIDTNVNLESLK